MLSEKEKSAKCFMIEKNLASYTQTFITADEIKFWEPAR